MSNEAVCQHPPNARPRFRAVVPVREPQCNLARRWGARLPTAFAPASASLGRCRRRATPRREVWSTNEWPWPRRRRRFQGIAASSQRYPPASTSLTARIPTRIRRRPGHGAPDIALSLFATIPRGIGDRPAPDHHPAVAQDPAAFRSGSISSYSSAQFMRATSPLPRPAVQFRTRPSGTPVCVRK